MALARRRAEARRAQRIFLCRRSTGPRACSRRSGRQAGPIKVGILHSLSGTMAISETSLKDVALMAIDEINAAGGVLGRKLEAGRRRPRVELAALRREGARTHLRTKRSR